MTSLLHWCVCRWAFLECLGFFSFFGILLIKTDSYRLDLIMCIITVFSISLLCYVVSDLDSPFSGFFTIDVSTLHLLLHRVKSMHDSCVQGINVVVPYPQPQHVVI